MNVNSKFSAARKSEIEHLWHIELGFPDGSQCSRQMRGPNLSIGPDSTDLLRIPTLSESLEIKGDSTKSEETKNLKLRGDKLLKVKVRKLSLERAQNAFHWEKDLSLKTSERSAVWSLWYFVGSQLVETLTLDARESVHGLESGHMIEWSVLNPSELILHRSEGDLRTITTQKTDRGFEAFNDNEHFVLTPMPKAEILLKGTHLVKGDPSSSGFRNFFFGSLSLWILLLFLMQIYNPMIEVEEPEQKEVASLILDRGAKANTQKIAKVNEGGNGQDGGGGVEYVETLDPRGGSGSQIDEVVVSDAKALFGGLSALSALASLDSSMNSKIQRAGIPNMGKGSSNGILGALAKFGGRGSGSGGLGLGGLGTKGFGGGGGGGRGAGYGTGIGDGLGKGNGVRQLVFTDGAPSVQGGLERSEVNAVVEENLAKIRFCYNRALRLSPTLSGKVTTRFVIGAEGTVETSQIKTSTLGSPDVEECIRTTVKRWQFPKPRGGGQVDVSYPFLLKEK